MLLRGGLLVCSGVGYTIHLMEILGRFLLVIVPFPLVFDRNNSHVRYNWGSYFRPGYGQDCGRFLPVLLRIDYTWYKWPISLNP